MLLSTLFDYTLENCSSIILNKLLLFILLLQAYVISECIYSIYYLDSAGWLTLCSAHISCYACSSFLV